MLRLYSKLMFVYIILSFDCCKNFVNVSLGSNHFTTISIYQDVTV